MKPYGSLCGSLCRTVWHVRTLSIWYMGIYYTYSVSKKWRVRPGTIDVYAKPPPWTVGNFQFLGAATSVFSSHRSRRRMALVDDYNPLNSRMSPVRCYKNYQELRFWGETKKTRSFVKSSINIGKNILQDHKKCRKVLKNVTLPTKCPLHLRSGKDWRFHVSGWRVELHRMYQNVSNVAFYEKRVADCCSKLDKACCSAIWHFPDEIWHQSVNGFVVVADLPLHTTILFRPTSDPLSILMLHVVYLSIHALQYPCNIQHSMWTYTWNSFLQCMFVFHHFLSL